VGSGGSLDILEKRKIFGLCQESNPLSSSPRLASIVTVLSWSSSPATSSVKGELAKSGLESCKCCQIFFLPIKEKASCVCELWTCGLLYNVSHE
jgi:hypothetical protein